MGWTYRKDNHDEESEENDDSKDGKTCHHVLAVRLQLLSNHDVPTESQQPQSRDVGVYSGGKPGVGGLEEHQSAALK